MEGDARIRIPKALMAGFEKEPYVLLKVHPAGLWPVDIRMLAETGLLRELASDAEFVERFQVVVMPR
jgi:hypothetical protein